MPRKSDSGLSEYSGSSSRREPHVFARRIPRRRLERNAKFASRAQARAPTNPPPPNTVTRVLAIERRVQRRIFVEQELRADVAHDLEAQLRNQLGPLDREEVEPV